MSLRIEMRGRVGNWAANSNHGLRLARAEYACFLHQDDFWLPNRVAVLRRLVSQKTNATLLLHPVWFVDTRGAYLGPWRCPLPVNPDGLQPEVVVPRLLVQNFIGMPAPTFPRELAVRLGGLDESLWFTPDWDLWLKLAAAGRTIYHSAPLAAFRIHPNSQTAVGTKGITDLRKQLETVQHRHLGFWSSAEPDGRNVCAAARLSTEVTLAVASMLHRQVPDLRALARALMILRPTAWYRFWRDSRIVERLMARLRLHSV
jgi:hypothetical protein